MNQPESRRDFLKMGLAASAATLFAGEKLLGKTLHVPLGLQLYSVRELLPKDYQGTLNEIGTLGYVEVESAGYYGHSAAEVRQAMQLAKLKLVSAHYSLDDLHKQLEPILAFHHELGVEYIICSFPGFRDPSRVPATDRIHAYTLDDWHWNAEQFNALGEKVHAAGMKFGYHNHFMEFQQKGGAIPFDELVRLTDPAKVSFEMDCGWVLAGGGDPIEYLRKYPKRISMLHVKDWKQTDPAKPSEEPPVHELGQGSIDYRPIFAQAVKGSSIRHIFVEQEEFDMPWQESLKVDADYMHRLGVS